MTERIVEIFEGFRMPPTAIDQYLQGGREALIEKLAPFVSSGKTIQFVMLGYPFKSTNHRDKTIGEMPDMAEEVSIQNFRRFGQAISQVHPAGVQLNIASDGYVFNDLLEEKDQVVEAYGEFVKAMTQDTPVSLFNLMDFYQGASLQSARDKVMDQFGITDVELEKRILFDADVNALYRGMIHFMEEEVAFKPFPSRNQLHKFAKALARKMMFRNEAYSHLVSQEFSTAIRLSMHPSTNNGAKYSFQLVPGPKSRFSPWHSALLVSRNGEHETIHKKDAEAAGYELVMREGRPYNYQEV